MSVNNSQAGVSLFRTENYRQSVWKNGGGTTLEVLSSSDLPDLPVNDWRISIATINRSGAYSDFGGYQRSQLMLQGPPLKLILQQGGQAAEDVVLTPMSQLSFDGAVKVVSELEATTAGLSVKMFNVMTGHTAATQEVNLAELQSAVTNRQLRGDLQLLFAVTEGLKIRLAGAEYALQQYDLLMIMPGQLPENANLEIVSQLSAGNLAEVILRAV